MGACIKKNMNSTISTINIYTLDEYDAEVVILRITSYGETNNAKRERKREGPTERKESTVRKLG